ncbi:hypothetical protein HNR46_000824 [Haloferula luteola]|uniref:LTD domain-containing protein n=1 Tax=Haloferula luteola TaxID=595692 RepID=A0A840V0K6_9BACT|nr:lamin tail domain-containing protein [Haloferula luteola]MBB5350596.1 hypothetical protein [Haloferula luteola]
MKIENPILLALALAFTSLSAHGAVVLNEVMASTTGADAEFIELYNTGGSPIDLSGWEIRLYESDAGASLGSLDGTVSITVGIIQPGGYFLIGNDEFVTDYGINPDLLDSSLSIENSSVTIQLVDSLGGSEDIVYMTDGGAGDMANIAGDTLITPSISIGPDGSFFPAGFTRDTPGGSTASILEFSPSPAPSATPTAAVPEPSLALLSVLGVLLGYRRQR